MEKIATKLTNYILSKNIIDEVNYDIYTYGFIYILEIGLSIITSIIIGLSLNMLLETIFFCFIFIPVRSFGGGLHLNKFSSCYLLSTLVLTGSLLIVKYFTCSRLISYVGCIVFTIIIFIIGPINHPNRPVTELENLVFKRKMVLTLLLCMLLATFLYYRNSNKYLLLEFVILVVFFISSLIPRLFPDSKEGKKI